MRCFILLLSAFLKWSSVQGQIADVLYSPDKGLWLETRFTESGLYTTLHSGKGELLSAHYPGPVLEPNISARRLRLIKTAETSYNETWATVWGERDSVRHRGFGKTFHCGSGTGERLFDIEVRLYDDGYAVRYANIVDEDSVGIYAEPNLFTLHPSDSCWWAWADYNTLEKTWQQSAIADVPHAAMPFTVRKANGYFLAFLEGGIENYTTATLVKDTSRSNSFRMNLVPSAVGAAVKTIAPARSPWRIVLATPSAAGLLASSSLLNLNEPCRIEDTKWIKPGNYCGIWWEMHLGLSTWKSEGGRHGATTENMKKYIDFAAANGIDAVLAEGWNTGWERWGEQGAFDYVTPYPDFDLREIVRYAQSKGVEVIGHHETGGDWPGYEDRLDSAFALYRSLGIRYVKTGYAGPMQPLGEHHHGQVKVEHLQRVVEKAAEYGIMVDAHEPVIPSGLSRTWPNLMTFEAVRGMEWNAWSEGNSPRHDCTLPFTRGLAGPMDYTPGIVDVLLEYRKEERIRWNGEDKGASRVHSTVCHQLALPIVFYSPLQMLADLPENYLQHAFLPILSSMPTTWDETKVLAADIGRYVVVARRKGARWYVAGIGNEEGHSLLLEPIMKSSSQLLAGVLYRDGDSTHYVHNPTSWASEAVHWQGEQSLEIRMQPGGGFLMVLE